MKKLIIAVAAAMLGVAANAAVCNWAAYDITASDSATIYGFESTTLSQQALLDAYNGTGALSFDDALNLGYASVIDEGEAAGDIAGYGNGVQTKAYLAIIDGSKMFISDIETGMTGGAGQAASAEFELAAVMPIDFGTSATFSGAGWYAAAPEPTSGLLLLLGMAGLALRRRRA